MLVSRCATSPALVSIRNSEDSYFSHSVSTQLAAFSRQVAENELLFGFEVAVGALRIFFCERPQPHLKDVEDLLGFFIGLRALGQDGDLVAGVLPGGHRALILRES